MRVFREIEYLPGNFFRSIVSKLLKKEIFRQAVEDESLGQGQVAEERPAQLALLQAWKFLSTQDQDKPPLQHGKDDLKQRAQRQSSRTRDQQVHKLNLCL